MNKKIDFEAMSQPDIIQTLADAATEEAKTSGTAETLKMVLDADELRESFCINLAELFGIETCNPPSANTEPETDS